MNIYQPDFYVNSDIIEKIIPMLFITFVIVCEITFAIYVLSNIGLLKLTQRNNISHSWLAFIPIANTYIFGKIAFEDKVKTFILLGMRIFSSIVSFLGIYYNTGYTTNKIISMLSWFSYIYLIFLFYAFYKIFKKYSDKAVIMLVFSVLSCGLLTPIFLFAIRNNERKIDVK